MQFLVICCIYSILFNVLYSLNPKDPSAICTGQGLVYKESNYTVCNCYDCFYGEHCKYENKSCILNAKNGTPLVYNEYWRNHTNPAEIDPYYRNGYQFGSALYEPSDIPISPQDGINYYLREALINLHLAVGNVNPENKYIVIGVGATQLINAVIYGFHATANKRLTVFATTPNWPQYKRFAQFETSFVEWNDSYDQQDNEDLIEFVSMPNNPVGDMRNRYYTNNKYVAYDMSTNWPSTTTNPTKNADYDVMIFSASKSLGLAGTRFGYAFVKSQVMAKNMVSYISLMQILPPIDAAYRVLNVLQQLSGNELNFFNVMRSVLQSRWNLVKSLFDEQNKYIVHSQFAFYFWISINDTSVNLNQVLKQYKIDSFAGSTFNATQNYARIHILQQTPTFNLLVQRLKTFLDV
eukprot:235815_1